MNTLKTSPDAPVVHSTLKTAYHLKGMYKEAIDEWEMFYSSRNDHEAKETLMDGYTEDGYLGAMLLVAELMEMRSQTNFVSPWQIGTLYTRAGKKEKALFWLEKAFAKQIDNILTGGVKTEKEKS